jgi:ABC-type polysaccharide/polyol phosphate transport system ATPase subunit
MNDTAIQVQHLSKRFRIGHEGRGDALDRFMDRVFGRRASRENFWALQDVSFDVGRGDNFGLVGPNGSGKSSLLKIVANIYKATSGRIDVKGHVITFLELGWGLLEDEQTGQANIYFAGTLFGMNKKEIDAVFDDIGRFAELEEYLDTPSRASSVRRKPSSS